MEEVTLSLVLKPSLEAMQVFIGRDRLFEVLRQNGLLVGRRRRRIVTTRWSTTCPLKNRKLVTSFRLVNG
ncbi:MAG: hypothetical protein H6577_12180 [Lewinellaceae bacterium]|nr:hypothetical protein [Lewinellaceae bacterium]